MSRRCAGSCAIAGIGQTEFSKESGRSELQLACEAVSAAIDDAGLAPGDVDGMVTFTMDSSDEIDVARNVGIGDLTFFSRVPHGGGAARRHGGARGNGRRDRARRCRGVLSRVQRALRHALRRQRRAALELRRSWRTTPRSDCSPPRRGSRCTPSATCRTYGVTNEDFGRIAVVDRAHAAKNPDAWFYQRPITLEDHQNSRWIVEPVLRLLDCCQESDGGVALVVTSAERARDLRQPPAVITAAAQGAAYEGEMMTSYYREDITGLPGDGRGRPSGYGGTRGWRPKTSKPPSSTTISRRSCSRSWRTRLLRARRSERLRHRRRLSLGGELPINTNGGLLGEAYIHGMNGITEGVRQVRGTSCNQVDNVEHVLVTSGTGVPTSGLILAPAG